MKVAEIIMAIVLALCSVGLMWKSSELPVGWLPEEGPGGGAFPFWLSAGMLVCCIWTLFRALSGNSKFSNSTEPFMDWETLRLVALAAGLLGLMIGLIHVIGVYFSVPLFLILYLKLMGRHTWRLTLAFAIITPIVLFFFFEIALRITLPKGKTEPLFYPLYDLFL